MSALAGKPSGAPLVDTSPSLSIDKVDWAKTLVHLLIVGASAILVVIGEKSVNVDFGAYNALLVPVISSGVTWLQKFLKNNDPLSS